MTDGLAALASDIVATTTSEPDKNPNAVELGKRGGSKGGKARAAAMSPEARTEAARNAANVRWSKGRADDTEYIIDLACRIKALRRKLAEKEAEMRAILREPKP